MGMEYDIDLPDQTIEKHEDMYRYFREPVIRGDLK